MKLCAEADEAYLRGGEQAMALRIGVSYEGTHVLGPKGQVLWERWVVAG